MEKSLRPPVWVGHVHLQTPDIAASCAFFRKLGMRMIFEGEGVGVLELRGGTHLVVTPGEAGNGERAEFDLMTEDLDATHRELAELDCQPSPIERGKIHDEFTVADPSGFVIRFTSDHTSEHPV